MRLDSPEPHIFNMQVGKTASEKDDRLAASLQSEEDVFLQKKRENKIKKPSKSLTNYQAIQGILEMELQTETNKDIQTFITQ